MYVPKEMNMKSLTQVHEFIQANNFGVLVFTDAQSQATHLPFLLETDEGQFGVLYGHMARANPHAKVLEQGPALAIFNGPHAYISPRWYARKPAVPTWNYAAVHVQGSVELLNDRDSLQLVQRLAHHHDPQLTQSNDIMTDDYVQRLLKAIVSFKLVIASYQGKLKLGQHKPKADQAGVYKGLLETKGNAEYQLVQFMRDWGYLDHFD